MNAQRIRTPCIGICSTTYGGDVCRGCKRFAHEVIDWNRYSEEQKQLVWDRLTKLVIEVVTPRLAIHDIDLMSLTLRSLGVRYHLDQAPEFGALELLRALGHQRVDLNRFGVAKTTLTVESVSRTTSMTCACCSGPERPDRESRGDATRKTPR